ncbi:ABC transporter substrate-binding protein [Kitasatospora sp. NPDC051853]|uniref:ABC transporter substrate-binding protein n=1 Tax=Kitasatospora sp. NPDC051853 TaxID=3364058 RepID=UPI00379E7D29
MRLTRLPAAAAALLLVLATACGSRLPQARFGPAGNGVTGSEIRIGLLASLSGPTGAETFAGPRFGARAFFEELNARGGVGGRTVRLVECDDGATGAGNQDCAHRLIDREHVFALVATTVLDYAGAPYVSASGVPDVGGQPVGTAYERWPHLYSVYGSSAPRDGRSVGWDGTLYQGTEAFRYFRERLGARSAVVVGYNQADSARYAGQLVDGLAAEGYRVERHTVDFALPDFPSVAAAVKARGLELVLDALDQRGNVALCQALEGAGVRPLAKVTTVQGWSETARELYRATPGCRRALWVTASSRAYTDTSHPEVRDFRAAMARWYPEREGRLSGWELEGWAAARWLADAMASCGEQLTRACTERFVNRPQPYDAHGLLLPASFVVTPPPVGPGRACLSVARWQDAAEGGRGGWVGEGPPFGSLCYPDVLRLPYRP